MGVPLLIVCTTRPELYERRPACGGGKKNALTVSLGPLEDAYTARIVAAKRAVLPAETQTALLARAYGNPLYAEQYARMVGEGGDTDALPETVQGIVGARLDLLAQDEKAVLQDAAVIGRVFWPGAVGATAELLRGLVRKEFVRCERRSAVAGEDEFSFAHALVRDVAYAQIPRGERAAKHRAAAAWIERLPPDRPPTARRWSRTTTRPRSSSRSVRYGRRCAAPARKRRLPRGRRANDQPERLSVGRAAL